MGQDGSKIPKRRVEDHEEKVELLCKESQAAVKLSPSEVHTLKMLYHRLAALSPGNEYIDKQTFLNYFPLEGILAERLFATFDKDKNNVIDYEEFLGGLALCLCGSVDEKFQLVFDLYNIDDGDGISEDELAIVLKSTLMAASAIVSPIRHNSIGEENQFFDIDEHVQHVVKDAFEQCDTSQTGKLSPQEFRTWAERHSYILDIIFGHKSFTDKQKITENITAATIKAAEMNSVRYQAQTWMESASISEQLPEPSQGYSKATYLWSPVFPVLLKAPKARSDHTVCVYQGALYLLGGRGSMAYKDFWKYDLALNNWSEIRTDGERPTQLFGHTVVFYKGSMYVYGGEFASCEKQIWKYTFASNEWKRITFKTANNKMIPDNRRHHSAVVYENKMYIFGGIIDLRGSNNELWSFDFVQHEWKLIARTTKSGPGPRYEHSAVVYSKAMWIIGGLENYLTKSDMWKWNFADSTWSKIKTKGGPFPIYGHRVVKCGNAMIVFGGSVNGEYHNMIWRFEFESQSWSVIIPHGGVSPPARSAPAVVTLSAFSLPVLPPQLVSVKQNSACKTATNTMVEELRPRSSPDIKNKEVVSGFEARSRHLSLSNDSIYRQPIANCDSERFSFGSFDNIAESNSISFTNFSYQSSVDESEVSKDCKTNKDTLHSSVRDEVQLSDDHADGEKKDIHGSTEGEQCPVDEDVVGNRVKNTDENMESKRLPLTPKEGLCIFLVGGKYCGNHEFFGKGVDIWRCDVTKRRKRSNKVTKINVQTANAGMTTASEAVCKNKEAWTATELVKKSCSTSGTAVVPLKSSNSPNDLSRKSFASTCRADLFKPSESGNVSLNKEPCSGSSHDTCYGDLVITDFGYTNEHHVSKEH